MKKSLKMFLIIISSFFGLILLISIVVSLFTDTPKSKVEKVDSDKELLVINNAINDSLEKESKIKLKKYQSTKAGKINKKHPDWTEDECTNIAEKRYWIGMTYEMLVYERGKPNSINPSNYGSGTQYQYVWDDYSPSIFYSGEDQIITAYN